MKFTGYVTIRLNSKRIYQKSIRCLGSKPLVNYPIAILNNIEALDKIILYSHDDLSMHIDSNLKYEWVKRPKRLDGNKVTFNEILDTIIDELNTDYIVFLCCTSPFIKSKTISDMISKIESGKYDSAFTAIRHQVFAWYKGSTLNYDLLTVPRTQDLEPVLLETSGLYIFPKYLYKMYKRRIGFKPYIKEVNFFEGLDIDTEYDFTIARTIWDKENEAKCWSK